LGDSSRNQDSQRGFARNYSELFRNFPQKFPRNKTKLLEKKIKLLGWSNSNPEILSLKRKSFLKIPALLV